MHKRTSDEASSKRSKKESIRMNSMKKNQERREKSANQQQQQENAASSSSLNLDDIDCPSFLLTSCTKESGSKNHSNHQRATASLSQEARAKLLGKVLPSAAAASSVNKYARSKRRAKGEDGEHRRSGSRAARGENRPSALGRSRGAEGELVVEVDNSAKTKGRSAKRETRRSRRKSMSSKTKAANGETSKHRRKTRKRSEAKAYGGFTKQLKHDESSHHSSSCGALSLDEACGEVQQSRRRVPSSGPTSTAVASVLFPRRTNRSKSFRGGAPRLNTLCKQGSSRSLSLAVHKTNREDNDDDKLDMGGVDDIAPIQSKEQKRSSRRKSQKLMDKELVDLNVSVENLNVEDQQQPRRRSITSRLHASADGLCRSDQAVVSTVSRLQALASKAQPRLDMSTSTLQW